MDKRTPSGFWSRVEKLEGCWQWTGGINSHGYGMLKVDGRSRGAHRFSWELHNGPIPEGSLIDHICHNRSCVNPEHLRLATVKQNGENMKGAQSNSTTGVRGVTFDRSRGTFRAEVTHHRKRYDAGRHSTLAQAEAAVIAKRKELFTHNTLDRTSV
jgi:hypothetical protein